MASPFGRLLAFPPGSFQPTNETRTQATIPPYGFCVLCDTAVILLLNYKPYYFIKKEGNMQYTILHISQKS